MIDQWWMQFLDMLAFYWAETAAGVTLMLAALATWHIVEHKRDARAAAAWAGLVWLVPLLGPLLYSTIGVNRIHRRARLLLGGELDSLVDIEHAAKLKPKDKNLRSLALLVKNLTGLPLTAGNQFEHFDAPCAWQAMLDAINEAQDSVYLSTFIFGNDDAGLPIVDALSKAQKRGVKIRVLVDGVGLHYSMPTVYSKLKAAGIVTERFLFSFAPWRMPYMNLRNHRKVLVVDQCIGFTGGMNIRQSYLTNPPTAQDLHFRVQGPVVAQLLMGFASDWQFTCGEILDYRYLGNDDCGDVLARVIAAGPDSDIEKRRFVLLSALNRAEKRVRIMTPYFVPEQTLMSAIRLARMRGVQVQVVLPIKNNLKVLHWAAMHLTCWLLELGVEVFWTAPPFDHSKLMLVDDGWVCLGSGNWDARSLRLNFELDVECYDQDLASRLNEVLDQRLQTASVMSREEYRCLPRLVRFRNAMAHLLEPYL